MADFKLTFIACTGPCLCLKCFDALSPSNWCTEYYSECGLSCELRRWIFTRSHSTIKLNLHTCRHPCRISVKNGPQMIFFFIQSSPFRGRIRMINIIHYTTIYNKTDREINDFVVSSYTHKRWSSSCFYKVFFLSLALLNRHLRALSKT